MRWSGFFTPAPWKTAALMVPYGIGTIFFGQGIDWTRTLGVSGILLGMVCGILPSRKKKRTKGNAQNGENRKNWMGYALGAFLLLGASQTLMLLPSYFSALRDKAAARTFLLYAGGGMLMCGVWPAPGKVRFRFEPPLVFGGGQSLC